MAGLSDFRIRCLALLAGIVTATGLGAQMRLADDIPPGVAPQQRHSLAPLVAPPSPASFALLSGADDSAPMATTAAATLSRSDCVARLDAHLAPIYLPFDRGAARIRADLAPLLSHIAALLSVCEDAQLMIAGHADADGNDQGNLALSWERADETLNALVSLGADPAALEAVGYGARAPVAQGSDDGNAANRRVEFRVLRRRE